MKSTEFKDWRRQMGLNQTEAADALGVNRTTIQNYERGARQDGKPFGGIPTSIALACSALFHRLRPWGSP